MFTALKGSQFKFVFAITAAGVMPCGDLKHSPYMIHSADYIFLLVLFDQRRYSEKSKIYRVRFILKICRIRFILKIANLQ